MDDDDQKREPKPQPQSKPEIKPDEGKPVTMLPDMGHVEKRSRDPADANFERH